MYEPVDRSLASLVAPLKADPRHSGVVCDIDGTLAPIVATPEEARVIPEALAALERLTLTYALVACVTGRPAAQARRMVPVDAVAISGNHGLEVWRDGAVHLAPQAAKYVEPMANALQLVRNDGLLPELGCHIEDKGIMLRVHPTVAIALKSKDNDFLEELEELFRRPALVTGDHTLHPEKFDIA